MYFPGTDGTGNAIAPQLPGLLDIGFDVRQLSIMQSVYQASVGGEDADDASSQPLLVHATCTTVKQSAEVFVGTLTHHQCWNLEHVWKDRASHHTAMWRMSLGDAPAST